MYHLLLYYELRIWIIEYILQLHKVIDSQKNLGPNVDSKQGPLLVQQHPKILASRAAPWPVRPSLWWCMGLVFPIFLVKFMELPLACSCSLLWSWWMTTLPSSTSVSLHSFASPTNIVMLFSIPSSGLLARLTGTVPSTDPWKFHSNHPPNALQTVDSSLLLGLAIQPRFPSPYRPLILSIAISWAASILWAACSERLVWFVDLGQLLDTYPASLSPFSRGQGRK